MKFNAIDNVDDFADEAIFWISLTDPPAELKRKAMLIDGEEYSEGCFAVWVSFYFDTQKFEFVKEKAGDEYRSVFYIDNDGQRNYLPYEIPEELAKRIFSECQKHLNTQNIESLKHEGTCTDDGCVKRREPSPEQTVEGQQIGGM